MFLCEICEAEFDEPFSQQKIENLDGENGIERQFIRVCPLCGEDHFRVKEGPDDE
ncbi:MAG: hypothetical protein LKJ86_08810 [Oscillibacter sp.]|jgi:Zn finger protein HypA/HybF involved in hydrogenase expression|nr:hypothetical protein [Oscillibacter sp.]